ncbi:Terminase-like family protein [Novipirellula galeiformis]|uniref:Terminase-like family protein n=1 Tax=Novipirellula galeiformis TaxID=2528004 RepID=A0A5C6CED2_9BACT|nr:terminase family protein [Novipirellula galeiformis]TWU22462.1 Terminase-like family protein [Novipirellula galeiformis]
MADDEPVEIRPNPGPQTNAFACPADILIYGGSAGGGKSFFLLAEPTRHVSKRGFNALIFRRTFPQVTQSGGLWDESHELYRHLGGKPRGGTDLDWTFPTGAKIKFAHLQHEKDKHTYQGGQIAFLGFDELTHFTETQFFYLITRMRSKCGVTPYARATCNPEPGWVADLIEWWIDPESGLAIQDRSGVVRYFIRRDLGDGEQLVWADSREELVEAYEDVEPDHVISLTFIAASLDDNPKLLEKDPGYRARLMAQPRVVRERLLKGNWLSSEGTLIDSSWLKTYTICEDYYEVLLGGELIRIPKSACRRFATIDTAGTSKEKAAEKRGDPPSWSVCGIFDFYPPKRILLARYVWRDRVDWNQLKIRVPSVLETWNCPKVYIENAHYGQPLSKEVKGRSIELIGPKIPGMDDTSRGAKLERAIASGMLSMVEDGLLLIPDSDEPWVPPFRREMLAWTGLPKETSDQIDIASYASYVARAKSSTWGGVIPPNKGYR